MLCREHVYGFQFINLLLIDESPQNIVFMGENKTSFLLLCFAGKLPETYVSLSQAPAIGVHSGHDLCRHVLYNSQHVLVPAVLQPEAVFRCLSLPCSTTRVFPVRKGGTKFWVQLQLVGMGAGGGGTLANPHPSRWALGGCP